jgi:glycosyltransferase involved in cell wall biosynthesis
MRILQVIHQFPPYSSQGSEVYCLNLSRQLRETEDVRVFHISNAPRRWRRRLVQEEHLGVPAYHWVDPGEYSRVASWPNTLLKDSFREVLEEFRPQIVHFHNYLSLGDDLVTIASSTGAAVVYTLHDYGLICPNALLLRSDRTVCQKETPDFFQDCCPTLIRTGNAGRRAWSANFPSLARWRLFSQQHPQPAARAVLLLGVAAAERLWGDPRITDVTAKRDFFFSHTRRLFEDADLFLAPSKFLMDRYVSCGLPKEKIVHMRYGMPAATKIATPPAGPEGSLRFGYLGALHPHKGLELLIEAFKGLGDRASLHIHGSVFGSPVSRNFFGRIRDNKSSNITFHGAYDNHNIHEIFQQLDVLVVPSVWYENSPLTIHEAFIYGVPVITANSGGMAELVEDGVSGLHFRRGDVTDLRRKMLQVIDDPTILCDLRKGIPDVPRIETHARELRGKYMGLLQ